MQEHNYEKLENYGLLEEALRLLDGVIKVLITSVRPENVSKLQLITSKLTPGSANIAFAIRELVRIGYLSPAEVLARSLLDRLGTIAYLRYHGDSAIIKWEKGWSVRERPSIKDKISCLSETIESRSKDRPESLSMQPVKQEIENLLHSLHGSVHGDPTSTRNTIVEDIDGIETHVIGPDTHNPDYCNKLCVLVANLVLMYANELGLVFDKELEHLRK